jgi:serine/threonine protein kinase/tetratricopeptide (TPR) repeat protein
MDEDYLSEAEAIFQAAADLSPGERDALLAERCGTDSELRAFVDQLLADDDSGMGSFLQPGEADVTSSSTASPSQAGDSESIGPYRVLEMIGEGGMGTVYAAQQTTPVRRKVAVKVIKAGMDSRQAIARFEAERQALALMDHPNIARVLDAGETEQARLYFVMDLVKGEPITDYCDRRALSTRERLQLFIPVCHAVQHAHQKGIIHRDLKPSNILVTLTDGQPVPKVIDFGIAKATTAPLTDLTLHTQQGQVIGTPAYMSPEQAEMGPLDLDTRSDIYSLGVVLYELLAGAPPFDPQALRQASFTEVRRIIREREPPKPSAKVSTAGRDATDIGKRHHTDPRTLVRQLKGELDWIVLRAIEKDRTRRYETASALATDIGRFLRDEPVQARPPSGAYRIRKFAKRHRVGLGVATTVLITLVGALIYSALQWRRTEDARQEAEAVTEFLAEMLGSVSPEHEGRDVKVQDVLEEAERTVGERFADRPRIEARLRHTIAAAYHALGQYEIAARQGQRAVDIRSRVLGPDDPETLQSRYGLAYTYGLGVDTDDAVVIIEDVLARQRRVLGDEHEDTLNSTRLLILLYKDQRRYQKAESLATDAIRAMRRTLGEDHFQVRELEYTLAMVLERQQRYEEAVALMEPVVRAVRERAGDDDPLTLEYMHVLARLYAKTGRFAEAEPLHLKVVEGRRRVVGEDSPWTMRALEALAYMYTCQGRFEEAERTYRDTIELASRTRGEEDNRTVTAKDDLAWMFTRQGRYDDAESLLVEVVDVRRRRGGPEEPATLIAMRRLALAYRGQARYDEAEQLLRDTLEIQRRVLGEEHQETLSTMYSLGRVYGKQGRFREAASLFARTLEGRRRVLGGENPNTLWSQHYLGWVYGELGRYDEAEPLLVETVEIRRRVLGEEDHDTVASMHTLGWVYQRQSRYEDAESLLVKTVEIRRRSRGAEHPETLRSMSMLAAVYAGQGRYEDAEQLYVQCAEIQRHASDTRLPDTLYNLACLAALRQDRSAALEWLREAVAQGFDGRSLPYDSMREDPDLSSLRGDPEFEALAAAVRRRTNDKADSSAESP